MAEKRNQITDLPPVSDFDLDDDDRILVRDRSDTTDGAEGTDKQGSLQDLRNNTDQRVDTPADLRGIVGSNRSIASLIDGDSGGFFRYDESSTATDDGETVIKPDAIASADPGRWLAYFPRVGRGGSQVPTNADRIAQSVAALRALDPTNFDADTTVNLLGYSTPGDGGGGTLYWGASSTETDNGYKVFKPDSVDAADPGRWILTQGTFHQDITVQIPSHYATLQAAIDDLSRFRVKQGVTITLNIESGHNPDSGVAVSSGDFGHFRITSTDASVALTASFSSNAFVEAVNAKAPVLDCLIDAAGNSPRGYNVAENSVGNVTSGNGVKNTTDVGLRIYNSRMFANGSNFSGASGYTLRASRGAIFTASSADFSGNSSGNDNSVVGSVYVNRGSIGNIQLANFDNCDCFKLIHCRRGSILNAHQITGDNITAHDVAFDCTRASKLDINDSTFTDIHGNCLFANDGGEINAASSTLSPSASNNGYGALASRGGEIVVLSAAMSGYSGNGLEASGGTIWATSANVSGAGNDGLVASDGGRVLAAACDSSGAGRFGAFASDGGHIVIRSGDVSGAANDDLHISNGGEIHARACTTTSGTPSTSDTPISSFNAISGRGIIWA